MTLDKQQILTAKLLEERAKTYGSFADHAALSQALKKVLQVHPKYIDLPSDMKEALEMIMHKVARIVNGDPKYVDSWQDVIGYTELIIRRLNAK
jgi:nucleoid-associated protein YejK